MSAGKKLAVLAIILVAVISTVVALLIPDREEVANRGEKVVVVDLHGPIEEGSAGFYSAITPRRVENALEEAAEDPSIQAVVLRLNSPGGAVAASQQIATMIDEFEKPVVVSMADTAASGGYYISAPADGIVAHPGTMTGSIGVIMTQVNPEGLYEMLGLEVETITSGERKDMYSRSLTEEEYEAVQEMIDEAYHQFIEEIVQGRDMEYQEVKDLATGELYMGSQAERLGLVDRLGGVDEAVRMAAELANLDDPQKYSFPEPSFFDLIFGPGFQLPELISYAVVPEEIVLMEEARRGVKPEIRYEYK